MAEKRKLSERHRTALIRDGIPAEMIGRLESEGLVFTAPPEYIARHTGVAVASYGIAFVYPGEDGYTRFRLDEPRGEMKYVSRRGDGCRLYVPPGVDLERAACLVVTEGEKKALAAAARGIACAAVAGIDSWRQRGPLGERLPPDEALLGRLKALDWSGRTVVLVYDSDIGPGHKRYDAFPALAEVLYACGADEVKVVTLPELPGAVEGKVGLDDFLLAYERDGGGGVERFWSLVERTPLWVPLGAGAKAWAERVLAGRENGSAERVRCALAALIEAQGELAAKKRIKELFPREATAAWRDAKRTHAEVIRRQRPARRREAQGPGEGERLRTFAEAFAPAAETPFAGYPVPAGWDIKPDGKVVRYREYGVELEEKTVLSCPVALATVLLPADGDTDDIHYEIRWYQDGAWRKMQIAAGNLFDHKRFNLMANRGVPVDSLNAMDAVAWLSALRDLQEKAGLPKKVLVSRSGWHAPEGGREMFAVGRDILTRGGRESGEVGPGLSDADPDDPLTEWTAGASEGERQMLDAIRTGGSLERQKETYLKYFARHPVAAFFTGAGAAAPLLRYLVKSGESDVRGFVVETTDPESGRGKTTLNMFPAGLWGKPAVGEMIRTANRTTVHSEVLFSVHCDISAHIDESQLVRYADAVAEIVYSLALGMGKERGAKSGGSRKTRRWHSVLVVSAERSILDVVKARQGVFDRVLSFPPLFPKRAEPYRAEAERIARDLNADYGHLGRRYVAWLLSFPPDERESLILAAYRKWKTVFDAAADLDAPVTGSADDGSSEKNQTLKRLAKRAAACAAGLELLLKAVGVPDDAADGIVTRAADAAWEHIAQNTEGRAFLGVVLNVLRSYVAENSELIEGLRQGEGRPQRWVGKVLDKDEVRYLALFPNAVAEALKRHAEVEYETAKKALRHAGLLATSKDRPRATMEVRLNGAKEWCLVVRADVLLAGDEAYGAEDADLAGGEVRF